MTSQTILEALSATTKQIIVEWQTEEGEWLSRPHQNEAAAVEFETKLDRSNVQHRRMP